MNIVKQENSLIEFNQEQVALIKSQIAPKASDTELRLFLYQCKRTGLDPLTRQIYAIHRWNSLQGKEVMTIQTSIDGFRVVAERSGVYAGQDEPAFEEQDGKLICCKVAVYKFSPNGQRYPAAIGVAYWDEYVQLDKSGNPSGLWKKMPHTMLSKVAEALALRKAFPQDLSGLYTSEEMQQADVQKVELQQIPTDEEKQLLKSLVYNSDLNEDEQEAAFKAIDECMNYKRFQEIEYRLESRAKSIDQISNPSQKDINNHIKKVAG